MDNDMIIIYTDAARDRLKKYTQLYADQIENEIKDRKWIPGDTAIEITASDIDYAANQIQIVSRKRISLKYLVTYFYFIIGLALIFYGIFYYDISRFFLEMSLFQMMLIYVGLTMLFVSVYLYMRIIPKKYSIKFIDFIEKKP